MNKVLKNRNVNKLAVKQAYVSPEIKVFNVELEYSIAVGSAIVHPQNLGGEIKEEWQVDPDDSRTINW